ncbi:MAG TPA: hypothetical protein VN653_10710 [Anaerolineales bacterium]|nr:hypothetical protein [Anaerolineales bacterium]
METSLNESDERLTFNSIKSGRHTATGILRDEDGNTFNIEVKGTNYDYVRKFIDYQLEKQGQGILTSVKPLSSREERKSKRNKKPSKKGLARKQTSWHGLSITIQVKELRAKTRKPQKVRVIIDPDIKPGESNQMDFKILAQEDANVKCEVTTGKVTCELFEFTDDLRQTSVSRQKATGVTTSTQFGVKKSIPKALADWNFRVIGEMNSNFVLSLDLKET